jgi:hypothetical protein
MTTQDGWRFCGHCHSMFFNGFFPTTGACAANPGGHLAQGFEFTLPHDEPETAQAQSAWRFCGRCMVMFFDGANPNTGTCPAGGGHQAQGLVFQLPHDLPPAANTQADWRFCEKCMGMFFDTPADKGTCPAGGGHSPAGFVFVLPHRPPQDTPVEAWLDSLRCHSETPGFGIGEGDEPFVVVTVLDFAHLSPVGTPTTEAILYGPLGGVDDQENHGFPFRPFWRGPLTPDSAVFVAAPLEHDSVNPEVTRSAIAAAVGVVALATAGAPRDRVLREVLGAISAAAEPVSGPGGVNRLIGPPAVIPFTADDIFRAQTGEVPSQVVRFNAFGDYSFHFLVRRAG